jgi:hypothetical protein
MPGPVLNLARLDLRGQPNGTLGGWRTPTIRSSRAATSSSTAAGCPSRPSVAPARNTRSSATSSARSTSATGARPRDGRLLAPGRRARRNPRRHVPTAPRRQTGRRHNPVPRRRPQRCAPGPHAGHRSRVVGRPGRRVTGRPCQPLRRGHCRGAPTYPQQSSMRSEPRLDERLLLSGSVCSRPSRSWITGKRTDRPRVTSRQVP